MVMNIVKPQCYYKSVRENNEWRRVTDKQLSKLQGMRTKNSTNKSKTLWDIFHKYLEMCDRLNVSFKPDYFYRSYDISEVMNGRFKDCPITEGEMRLVIKYGLKNNLLIRVSKQKRYKLRK